MWTSNVLRFVLFVIVIAGLLFALAAYVAWIDPGKTYGFWAGIKHGFFMVQNGIIGLFTGREYWAPLHTRAYSWGFYTGLLIVPGMVRLVSEIVTEIVRGWR